jgi:PhnB protein
MATVNVYLTFDGQCEAAFLFYQSVFGGSFTYMGKYNEMPPMGDDCQPLSEEDGNRVMHVTLPISKETCLMGSDIVATWTTDFQKGNNYSVSINTESKAEANRLFEGLSAGGHIKMPLEDTFWGAYFGMFTDKFGIHWMVNFDEDPQNEY